jgi:hypothetical protein
MYSGEGIGYLTKETKFEISRLGERRRKILIGKEEAWRLKTRSLWLLSGDENSKFFHQYANFWKKNDNVSKVRNSVGLMVSSF